jgi:hypothetical protein
MYRCSKPAGWFAYVSVNNISLHSPINFSFYLKNIFITSVISGFHRQVAENCALLCYYAASGGKRITITHCAITQNGAVFNIFKTQLMFIRFFPHLQAEGFFLMQSLQTKGHLIIIKATHVIKTHVHNSSSTQDS